MIVLNKVSKTYTSKKGFKTVALNEISLQLPNTGVVFVVGKSGAGKSTFLNILGGLDYADSGEIIINGRSTKDFTKSEYDSYRNTYVGFVFQEYYMLNNLTVGQNISLAIKLQNRQPDSQEISSILSQVGLEGYIDRHTNELSGGELQRVAIARALIKNPKIIIADEPTGALDSNTSTQIFETLKGLSKDHLVLVVSHEQEFAQSYADRIIEIKDGNVISDVTKTSVVKTKKTKKIKKISDGISFENGSVVINPQHKLSTSDVALINDLIANKGKVEETQTSVDTKGVFKPTKEVPDEGNNEPINLIKSKLPLKDAIRMSLNALRHKKFRLIISIFLSVISFTTLGLSSTLSTFANPANIYSETFSSSIINFARIEKRLVDDEVGGVYGTMTEDDQERLKEVTGLNFTILTTIHAGIDNFIRQDYDIHYLYQYTNKAYVPLANFKDANIKSSYYDEPTELKEGEVAISKHMFEMFKKHGYHYQEPVSKEIIEDEITDEEDILDRIISFDYDGTRTDFKIKDIYDTNFNDKDPFFEPYLNEKSADNLYDKQGYQEYDDYQRAFGNTLFMSKTDIDTKLVPDKSNKITSLIVGIPKKTKEMTNRIYSFTEKEQPLTEKDKDEHPDFAGNAYAQYRMIDSVSNNVVNAIESTETFRYLFLLIGGAFAIFSGLLLANFIAGSIAYQRKEIGILRAIGARGTDVLKIYSAESFFIAFINFLLSLIFTILVFNGTFAGELLILTNGIPIFVFSYIQVFILLGVAFLSAFLSTFIPIRRIAKKKPIDAIRLR